MNTEEIRAMVVEQMGLQDLPAGDQDQIIDQFTENTIKKIVIVAFERLPEEAKAEFGRLGDAGDSEGLMKLLRSSIPNLDALILSEVKNEVAAFKNF